MQYFIHANYETRWVIEQSENIEDEEQKLYNEDHVCEKDPQQGSMMTLKRTQDSDGLGKHRT